MKKISDLVFVKFYYVIIALIFILALFLRAYHIASVPDVIELDEASLGYNAWCIAHYGVDRYLNPLPIYPQNQHGGQSPLYTYLVVFLIKTMGRGDISLWLVRLPGLISSMLVVIFGTKCISRVFQNRRITMMGALLLTACPYFVMHGRFALDCNLMLGCSTIAVYCLIRYIQSNRLRDLILCGISFGVVLYSYALSYFVIPVFLCLTALYLLFTRKITLRRTVLWAVCVCLTSLPVILFICALLFQLPPFHFLGFTITPIASDRMKDVASTNFWDNVTRIIWITLTNSNYPLDAVDKFYTMYFISIPFIIIGIAASLYHMATSLKTRTFHPSALFLFFYVSGLFAIGLSGAQHIYRANYFFLAYLYFLVNGITVVYRFVRSYRKCFICTLSVCYLIWCFSFFRYYFGQYSVAAINTYPNSLYFIPIDNAIEYAQNGLNAEQLYIDYVDMDVYHSFYFPNSPYEVKSTRHKDGYGKYHFIINYYTPLQPGNAYIVRTDNQEFFMALNNTSLAWEAVDYPYYKLFYFPKD